MPKFAAVNVKDYCNKRRESRWLIKSLVRYNFLGKFTSVKIAGLGGDDL